MRFKHPIIVIVLEIQYVINWSQWWCPSFYWLKSVEPSGLQNYITSVFLVDMSIALVNGD